jgi:hypothetical protein
MGYIKYGLMWLPGLTFCTWYVPEKFKSLDFNTANNLCMAGFKEYILAPYGV